MQDIHTPVRELFYGIITGEGLTCYEADAVPDDAATPYVIIASVQGTENSDKTSFGNNVQILLDVVTSVLKNKLGGSKQADTIAGTILSKINSKTKLVIGYGLQVVNTKVLQDIKQSGKSDTHNIYRRLIRYQQLIKEV